MSLNYSTLQARIASWLARTDLTTEIQYFIEFATSDLNATFFPFKLLSRSTLAVSSQFTSLPADFRRLRSVSLSADSKRYVMEQMDLESFNRIDTGAQTTYPARYVIVGSTIGISQVPSSATLELVYWPTIPDLTDEATTNDVLTTWPLLYLYRAAIEGAVYMRDDSLQARAEAAYGRTLAAAIQSDKANAYGSAPIIRAG